MMALCRFVCALLAAALCAPAMMWLTMSALAMLGFHDAAWGNRHWMPFCALAALACAAPAVIRAWPPRLDWRASLREGLRCALFSFAMFIAGLLLLFKPALQFLGFPMLMAPVIAEKLAGALTCPLFLASWIVAERLLPLPAQEEDMPAAMRPFQILSLAGIALLAAVWLVSLQVSPPLPGRPLLFGGVWIALALRRGTAVGDRGSALAWIAFCSCLTALCAMTADWSSPMALALTALPLLPLLASCLSLFRRSAWRKLS